MPLRSLTLMGPGLVRLEDHEADEQYGCDDKQQDCEDAESVVGGVPEFSFVYLGENDQCDTGGEKEDADEYHQKSVGSTSLEDGVF